jgi:glycosyltransferase involved in cell wall biosynthesis
VAALCGGVRVGEKHILMMINFFPPAGGGGVYRPLAFVKYLVRLSWNVTVVTPRPGEFWISDPDLEKEIPPSVRVVRTPSLSGSRFLRAAGKAGKGGGSRRSSRNFGFLRRLGEYFLVPDTYVGWVPFAVRAAGDLIRVERFDALYSTSPPDSTHLAAHRIARRFSIPWVADCRDPWIALYLRDPPTPLHRALNRRMERTVASADRILVTTSWHEERLRAAYPGIHIERIPNGYDEEDFRDADTRVSRPGGAFTIVHCGMLTLGRSSRPFLDGLARLVRRSPAVAGEIRVVFIGARESANEAWVGRFGLENIVSFEDSMPHTECIRRERESHVLLLVKHDDERYRGLVPGKLYEYIGARRPILAVVPAGEAARLVTDLERGEVADIGDPDDIAEKVWKMLTLHRDGKLESSYNLAEVSEFSRRSETERLAAVLEGMVNG